MRKSVLPYVNNKDADQPAHPRSFCAAPFESHLVENPEDRFSRDVDRMLCVYKSPIGIIVTTKHCFYFSSCRKAIPEDATGIYRTTAVNVPFSSLPLTICSIFLTAVTASLYKLLYMSVLYLDI